MQSKTKNKSTSKKTAAVNVVSKKPLTNKSAPKLNITDAELLAELEMYRPKIINMNEEQIRLCKLARSGKNPVAWHTLGVIYNKRYNTNWNKFSLRRYLYDYVDIKKYQKNV